MSCYNIDEYWDQKNLFELIYVISCAKNATTALKSNKMSYNAVFIKILAYPPILRLFTLHKNAHLYLKKRTNKINIKLSFVSC